MKISKIPRKYQLSINLLDKKKTVFPISEKFKTGTFPYSKETWLSMLKKISSYIIFLNQKKTVFPTISKKSKNKNFPII